MQATFSVAEAVAEIVAQASLIEERLDGACVPDPASQPATDRLARWQAASTKGDAELFRARLGWDGLTPEGVAPLLGRVRLRDGAALPAWADVLADILAESEAWNPAAAPRPDFLARPDTAERQIPFEEFFVPFVRVGVRRLAAAAGDDLALLGPAAWRMMQRALLYALCEQAAPTLQLEFSILRAQEQSSVAWLFAAAQGRNERTVYNRLIERLRGAGLLRFFREYAVLARMLATVVEFWAEASAEFLARLAADAAAIGQSFGIAVEPGALTEIETGMSDAHNGRRGVYALHFADGQQLIYKPKDLGTEVAYGELLEWLNGHGAPLDFKPLIVLDRGTHGWVEFVRAEPLADEAAARRYYRRAGMLLGLAYALDATDCHCENLIAAGEYPVLVDMETLLHHRPTREEEQDRAGQAYDLAQEFLERSVLRPGLLPVWEVRPDNHLAYDRSGLGGADEQAMPYEYMTWDRVNSDQMALVPQQAWHRPIGNVPRLDGKPLHVEEYADEVVAGFRAMYELLMARREELSAPGSPLYRLGRQLVRFIYRSTRIYRMLQIKLMQPEYLRDGAEWSIGVELLARAAIPTGVSARAAGKPSRFWPLFGLEQRAMIAGDTPFFRAHPDSADLGLGPDGLISAAFREPSLDRTMNLLATLDEADMERQVAIIESVFYSHNVGAAPRNADPAPAEIAPQGPATREQLQSAALAIVAEIERRAIRAPDGSMSWIMPRFEPQSERYQLLPSGYNLYDGATGIALFLGAAYRATGEPRLRELALGALQPVQWMLREYGAQLVREIGIGGMSGVGSVIYALLRLSEWLGEPALLQSARQAAELITPERIAADNLLDVMSGSAGAALGLLALYDAEGDALYLERARACGERLLATRRATPNGPRSWAMREDRFLTGFSHGAAGIAYALGRLYEATADEQFAAAAREALDYETSVFSAAEGNWPDLRVADHPGFMTSWCHGAPGIGLGRIGGLATLDGPQVREDIAAALATTLRTGVSGLDHLCCGSGGRADMLLFAAAQLDRPDLAATASMWVAQMLARADATGRFKLNDLLPPNIAHLGFFQGLAGLGYLMLRVAYPGALPAVLLLQ